MGIDGAQYRECVGKFYPVSRNVKRYKRLNYKELYCIHLINKYRLNAIPLALLLFTVYHDHNFDLKHGNTFERVPSFEPLSSTKRITADHIAFLLFVLCILLLISGIEINPGPSRSTSFSSLSSVSSMSSNLSGLIESSVSFLHLNIQSVFPKLDNISAEYSCHDILSFTESWLKPSVSSDSLKLPGYKLPFRRDRPDRLGGGVIIYVKDDVNCKLRQNLQIGSIECIWLELRLKHKKLLYGTFYIPPHSSQNVWDEFEQSVDLALDSNCDIIITGDFNINMLGNQKARLDNVLTQFSLYQLITNPTYVTEHSSSLLDLILVNNPHCILTTEVGPPLLEQVRYHMPTVGIINHPNKLVKAFKRKIFLYDRGNYNMYRQQLAVFDWDALFVDNDTDSITGKITDEILQAANKCIPNRIITVRKDNPPWLTSRIKRCIRRKNRLHRKAKRTNTPTDWGKFRTARNKCNKEVVSAKMVYYADISEKIKSETVGARNWWSLVKSLVGDKNNRSIPPIDSNGELISDDSVKSELFNNFFSEQSRLNDGDKIPPDITDLQNDGLHQVIITETEVEDILKTLDTSKATGPDLINPRLLKEASDILKRPLCKLFNLSLSKCYFPSDWKNANVIPVFKKDCPSFVKNYRPISLISVIGKVMERCVYKHVYNFLLENGIITFNQSGFTPGDSAINQLLFITNEFGKALDEGKEIRVVFCDISKAFDRVWHKGLLKKLKSIGIRGSLLSWMESYLSNRKQRVVINGCSSDWRKICAGVPQGSILGPLFFIIFINDIVTDINSSIKLFADDTSLYLIVDDPLDTSNMLNSDLNKIHEWSMRWLVKFNPEKTESMVISRKLHRPLHPPLLMDGTIINTVSNHIHLGLEISNDGTWAKHIDMISKKAFARLNILRKFKFILDRGILEKIYLSFVRPLLEYGDVIWDNNSVQSINKLEGIQTEAARIITGGTRLVSINKLYIETGWERLKDRREKHRLTYFYKMRNGLTPEFLSNLVPQNLRSIHDHNTRHSHIIPPIRTRTALYSNYFLPQSVRSWNHLVNDTKNCPSLNAFKSTLNFSNKKKSFIYYIGSRLGQIHHARLRMECSALNYHLFSKNIIQSENCACGVRETTQHYFFHCPRYNNIRQRYLTNLNLPIPTTLNVLIFGSDELTLHQNTEIFLAVHRYIINSKRFTP